MDKNMVHSSWSHIYFQNTFISVTSGSHGSRHAQQRSQSECSWRLRENSPVSLSEIALKEQLHRLNKLVNSLQSPDVKNTLVEPVLYSSRFACQPSSEDLGKSVASDEGASMWMGSSTTVSTNLPSSLKVDGLPTFNSATLHDLENVQRTDEAAASSAAQDMLPDVVFPVFSKLAHMSSAHAAQGTLQQLKLLAQLSQMMVDEWAEEPHGVCTTAMLRNIPYSYTPMELVLELEELGFKDKYNFLFLPRHAHGNIGYAFVNLTTPEVYQEFNNALQGYRFKLHKESFLKKASVKAAAYQGYQENIERVTKLRPKPGLMIFW